MKYKTRDHAHAASMLKPAYQAVYEDEIVCERLQETLREWRNDAGLTSAQVAEHMGVKPSIISRMERNATKMSYETLIRYARACGINFELRADLNQ